MQVIEDAVTDAVTEALKERRQIVHHREYKTTEDFPGWLRSYVAKCRATHGLKRTPADETKLKEEIIITISCCLALNSIKNLHYYFVFATKN